MQKPEYNKILEDLKVHQIELESQNVELKKAHEDLLLEKNSYQSLVNMIPVGFLIINEDGKILYCNKKFVNMTNGKVCVNSFLEQHISKESQNELYFFLTKLYQNKKNYDNINLKLNLKNKDLYVSIIGEYNSEKNNYNIILQDITDIQNQLRIIKKNQNRLKQANAISKIGSWEYDFKTETFWLSSEAIKILELEEETFDREKFYSLIHKDDLDYVKKFIQKKIETNNEDILIFRIFTKKNKLKYLKTSSSIFKNEYDINDKVIGILQDISLEIESNKIEKIYYSIFENSHDAIIIVDIKNTILHWNKSAERIYGYNKEEALGHNITDICKSYNDSESCTELIEKYINGQKIIDKRVQRLSKDNKVIELAVTISDIKVFNKIGAFSIIARDITEKVKTDDNIRKLNQAIEQSANSIVITDIDGNIEYVNNKFTEVTGYSYEEAIGENPRILKSGKHNDDHYIQLWKTISDGKVWRGEFINKNKDDEYFWEEATISPVTNSNGNIINYIAIKENITKLKHKEKELQKAIEKVEQANNVKSVILGNLSHELRTPLNGIIGGIQIIKSTKDYPNKDVIDLIEQSAERLHEALSLMLDLSKIQTEDINIRFEKVNMPTLLRDILMHNEELFEAKDLKTELIVDDDNIYCNTDQKLFVSMFKQLILNAVKFTEKGKITVFVKYQNTKKDGIIVSINDTGVGIPEERLGLIFEEFRQVSEGISRKYEGLGLGLTFVTKIAQILNGKINIKSEYGEGTEVEILLKNNLDN